MKLFSILGLGLWILVLGPSSLVHGREYPATVLRVIDGDTVEVRIDLGFGLSLVEPVRLAGIDAPEMSTPAGPLARRALTNFLPMSTAATLRTGAAERDKYGRVLGDLLVAGRSAGQEQLLRGHARPYDGGKRTKDPTQ
jgi:endonuclease YncB( thermonuclease family)